VQNGWWHVNKLSVRAKYDIYIRSNISLKGFHIGCSNIPEMMILWILTIRHLVSFENIKATTDTVQQGIFVISSKFEYGAIALSNVNVKHNY